MFWLEAKQQLDVGGSERKFGLAHLTRGPEHQILDDDEFESRGDSEADRPTQGECKE